MDTTLELLRYWQRDGRNQNLFFAQVEAAETVIFLKEAREDFKQGLIVPRDITGAPGSDRIEIIECSDSEARYVIDMDISVKGKQMTVSSYLVFEKDADGLWRIVFF